MKIEFYIHCFDRVFIIELNNPNDMSEAKRIIEKSYDEWVDPMDDIGDVCCEEYICECLIKEGIVFMWLNKEE